MEEWAPRVSLWQAATEKLISFTLKNGMPLLKNSPTLQQQTQFSRNAEETLWCLASACTARTEKQLSISWPSETSAGEMLHRIRGQRWPPDPSVCLSSLAFTNFKKQNLVVQDLFGANFYCASFVDAKLTRSELGEANFQRADLTGAQIQRTDLTHANFIDATCIECLGFTAGLSMAIASGSNWSRAKLAGATLTSAEFRNAILDETDLQGANLSEGSFSGALFRKANLSNCDCSGADFSDADFTSADLTNANFSGANIRGAIFSRTKTEGISLEKTFALEEIRQAPSFEKADLRSIVTSGQFKRKDTPRLIHMPHRRMREVKKRSSSS